MRALKKEGGTPWTWVRLALHCEHGSQWEKRIKPLVEKLCEPYLHEGGVKGGIGKKHTRVAYCISTVHAGGDAPLLMEERLPAAVLEVVLKTHVGGEDLLLRTSVPSGQMGG
ncbi:Uncharacterised protein [uncultured archaeon]|nr:Uncharacterised protein [uncultured archaeon]